VGFNEVSSTSADESDVQVNNLEVSCFNWFSRAEPKTYCL
jgi:hypothetical protein